MVELTSAICTLLDPLCNGFVIMSTLPNLLRSLLIAGIFSFLTPVLLVSLLLASAAILSYLPYFNAVGATGLEQLGHFLKIFGSGSSLRGLFVIGLVGSLAGMLFDTYTFYRLQTWRNIQN
jgi:hypothetical protein